ncbi:cupin domain-containing protein [uncultured Microbacterium sp.]|uniref:cupin domain-containing protein n=1 Tax=uncultured Microbacterium sp. TaxID=191216 RepID=UPI0025FE1976|nr:cupin domain-containing protein [uncultured Microbacterium sp.]
MSPTSADAQRGSGDARPALSRLLGSGSAEPSAATDVETFAADYWSTRPLLTRGAGDFSDLFDSAAVDELVADRGLRTPFVRMAREGSVLPASRFTSSGGFGAEIGDQLDSAKVLAEFAAGTSLVLQGLHRTWEPIARFTRALVADLGHPAQVNAYITPASSRGFDPHYDTHDVFVIQIAGEKRWRIHEPVHEDPLADQPWSDHREAVGERAGGEPYIDAVFRPGDVLYLPRGWIHSAVAQGGTSIHLTIGVRATTRDDVLRRLLALAAGDVELRRSLPLGVDYTDPAALADVIDATRAAAARAMGAVDDRAVADDLQRGFVPSVRPAPVRPLATVDLLADLDPSTAVRWRDGLRARVVDDPDLVRILLPHATVSLPVEASTAVHALQDTGHRPGAGLAAGALPALDPASSLVVARRLLREGVIVPIGR